MPESLRGLAERKNKLYLVTDSLLYEIEDPKEGKIARRRLTPRAAAFLLLGKSTRVKTGTRRIELVYGEIKAVISAGSISSIRIFRVKAPSLTLAEWASKELAPGIPYYDVVDRLPELAVPKWWTSKGICNNPLFSCEDMAS